jgi:hypothetical protein
MIDSLQTLTAHHFVPERASWHAHREVILDPLQKGET